ncbi:hypothetical protein HDV00_005117 [Rhizophlyctis rosea]|nr:hypothetical protein HDV00_005117 [Rhizophlyctis rosea]
MDNYVKALRHRSPSYTSRNLTSSPATTRQTSSHLATSLVYDLDNISDRERCDKLEELLIAKDAEITLLKRQLAEQKYAAAWDRSRQGSTVRASPENENVKWVEMTGAKGPQREEGKGKKENATEKSLGESIGSAASIDLTMKTPTPAARRPTREQPQTKSTKNPASPPPSAGNKENTTSPTSTKQTALTIITRLKNHIRDLRRQLEESHRAARVDAESYSHQIKVLQELLEAKDCRLRALEKMEVRDKSREPSPTSDQRPPQPSTPPDTHYTTLIIRLHSLSTALSTALPSLPPPPPDPTPPSSDLHTHTTALFTHLTSCITLLRKELRRTLAALAQSKSDLRHVEREMEEVEGRVRAGRETVAGLEERIAARTRRVEALERLIRVAQLRCGTGRLEEREASRDGADDDSVDMSGETDDRDASTRKLDAGIRSEEESQSVT